MSLTLGHNRMISNAPNNVRDFGATGDGSTDDSAAIQLALELNPQVEEGGTVKVPLPRVSMEVREQIAKQLKKMLMSISLDQLAISAPNSP